MIGIAIIVQALLGQSRDRLVVAESGANNGRFSTLEVDQGGHFVFHPFSGVAVPKGYDVTQIASSAIGIAVQYRQSLPPDNKKCILQLYAWQGSHVKLLYSISSSQQPDVVWYSEKSLYVFGFDPGTRQWRKNLGPFEIRVRKFDSNPQVEDVFPKYKPQAKRLDDVFNAKHFHAYVSRSTYGFYAESWIWPLNQGYKAGVSDDLKSIIINRSDKGRNVVTVVDGNEDVWDLPLQSAGSFSFFEGNYVSMRVWSDASKGWDCWVFNLATRQLVGSFPCKEIG